MHPTTDTATHWVFGYGSLIWNPGFAHVSAQQGLLRGAHRSLSIISHHHRGTVDRPGLVFGLTRAEAVQRAFRTGRHLAVQGPTGVGKSLAYLLPAVAAAREGRRTVVVTSSKALQDQLAGVDLPFLERVLDQPFSFTVLKGRSNYLCEAAASEVRVRLSGRGQQRLDLGDAAGGVSLDDPHLRRQLTRILDWAEGTDTGDLAELEETPPLVARSAVSVGPGECVGATRCSHAEDCWSERARTRAEESDIVVVNAHLYGAHVATGGPCCPRTTCSSSTRRTSSRTAWSGRWASS